MWIRRSDLEIQEILKQKELQKKSPKRLLIIGAGFGLFFLPIKYMGLVFFGLMSFFILFVPIYYHHRKGSCRRCADCLELSPDVSLPRCQCGGHLEPSYYYTWEE